MTDRISITINILECELLHDIVVCTWLISITINILECE